MEKTLSKKEEKILDEFKSKLSHTKNKKQLKHPYVVAMVGLVGSGKSSVAKEAAKKIGAVVVVADDIRIKLREDGEEYKRVDTIVHILTKYFLEKRFSVVLDKDHVHADTRNTLKKIAKDLKAKVYYIRTVCDADVLRRGCAYRKSYKNQVFKIRFFWRSIYFLERSKQRCGYKN